MITIEQAPQIFHPAYNPCYFVLDSNNKTNAGFRYIVEVQVGSTIIATYRTRPVPITGLGEVDISKAIQTTFDNDFQQLVSYDAEQHYLNYNLVLSEEYFVSHALFGARVATGSGTWAWANWSDTAFNPTGANLTQWASLTEPPFEAGDNVTINQLTGLLPSLEGSFTVVDKFLLGGVWYLVINLPWIGGGVKANTATATYTNGQKFREEVAQSGTFTSWRGAFRFAEFPDYDNEKYLLNFTNKELLTTMPDGFRISRTQQTRFALRRETTYNFHLIRRNGYPWSDFGVTDEASLVAWLAEVSDYTAINVTNLVISGTELKCNVSASGGSDLVLINLLIQEIIAIGQGFIGLLSLILESNPLTEFNPIIPLPNTLQFLLLENNNISDWSLSEPWATLQTPFTNLCEISTSGNPTPAIGTNFEAIINTKNATVTF